MSMKHFLFYMPVFNLRFVIKSKLLFFLTTFHISAVNRCLEPQATFQYSCPLLNIHELKCPWRVNTTTVSKLWPESHLQIWHKNMPNLWYHNAGSNCCWKKWPSSWNLSRSSVISLPDSKSMTLYKNLMWFGRNGRWSGNLLSFQFWATDFTLAVVIGNNDWSSTCQTASDQRKLDSPQALWCWWDGFESYTHLKQRTTNPRLLLRQPAD